MKPVNTQCRLAARPTGLPKATDFTIVDEPVPAAADGEFVVEIIYLSIDPAMRTWMNAGRSYVPPGQIGDPHGPANYMQLLVARASMTGSSSSTTSTATPKALLSWESGLQRAKCGHTSRSNTATSAPFPRRSSNSSAARTPANSSSHCRADERHSAPCLMWGTGVPSSARVSSSIFIVSGSRKPRVM